MKPTVIVDIDAILWCLDPHWWDELKKINPDCPKPGTDGNWNFYENHLTWDQAYEAATTIHMNQHKYKPFKHASAMLNELKDAGLHVIIASHRNPESCGATVRWLSENNMPYNDLYLAPSGKENLFKEHSVVLFIDDSPKSIMKAVECRIPTLTIKYSYNQSFDYVCYVDDDYALYLKVKEVCDAIKKRQVEKEKANG